MGSFGRDACWTKENIFWGKNVAQVAFWSIVSTGIVCNEYYILFRWPEPWNSASNCKFYIKLATFKNIYTWPSYWLKLCYWLYVILCGNIDFHIFTLTWPILVQFRWKIGYGFGRSRLASTSGGLGPLKSLVTGPSLLVNCYIQIEI